MTPFVHAFDESYASTARLAYSRASNILSSLILKIDFNVAEEEVQPDNTMEHWEETIKELYKDKAQKKVCSEVLGALRTIAGGGAYELDKSYTPLKDDGMEDPPLKITSTKDSTLKRKAWKDNFTGSIHCGVIIAIHQPEGSNVSLSMILHFHNFIHILTTHSSFRVLGVPNDVAFVVLLCLRKL